MAISGQEFTAYLRSLDRIKFLEIENESLHTILDKINRDQDNDWCDKEGECWLMDGPCSTYKDISLLKKACNYDSARIDDNDLDKIKLGIEKLESDLCLGAKFSRKNTLWYLYDCDGNEISAGHHNLYNLILEL